MNGFFAVIVHDLKLALRTGGSTITLLAFYLSIGMIMPIAIGPDKDVLAQLSPAIIWVGALLSLLLGLERLFVADYEDGTLQSMRNATISLEAISFAKLIVHWLTTALPLILATPILAIMLIMDLETFLRMIAALLVGTPALVALGALGAAVAVSLKRGSMIAPILILPMATPVLIFGVSAVQPIAGAGTSASAFLFLGAFSLLSVAFIPFAIALALRSAAE
ncbi:ABC transporter involved in cytochrome c biogenesis, CcmB subunit [hydrothermal vent metagenome]|uniref:Heme exporter protein B n=1 Tax=hydrothermal vent metagenome TaxID=652676 RepID=A0A3B0U8A9_9ZZZZ